MPRGSGHPDLSRPRREAPGILTAFAILERELGAIDYARHRLEGRLQQRPPVSEARKVREDLEALETRRRQTLLGLDDLHDEWDGRHPGPEA